jgi:methionyl-tRNA synthetase
MYVWFDALTNYLSGIGYFSDEQNIWPATHVIGQDIIWFHAVIWPCMLMSAGISLPRALIVHGFINDSEGRKMSKSLGNVVDPNDLLEKYTSDMIRYYLIRGGLYGSDFKFSEENLIEKNNGELADLYGNLVRRVFTLAKKFCDSKVSSVDPEYRTDNFDLSVISEIDSLISTGQLYQGLELVVKQLQDMNKWIYEQAPWSIKEDYSSSSRKVVCLDSFTISFYT